MGYAFVEGEQLYGVNGIFVIAVGWHESGGFKSTANTYNYWGRKAKSGGWASWSSKYESILSEFSYFVNSGYYNGKTIAQIQNTYCPDGTAWAATIQNYMSKFYNKVNF